MASRGWVKYIWAACGVTLAAAGCGHTTSSPSGSELAPAGASAGGSRSSPPAVAGASGASTAAFGGTASTTGGNGSLEPAPTEQAGAPSEPKPHAAEPCENPQPSPYGGGFVHCEDGSFRRPEPAACVSALPRSEPAKDRLLDECEYDADCTEKAHGSCELGECRYGCTLDSECEAGQLCFCGAVIGQCEYVGCRSDADCPADYPCTGNIQKLDRYLDVQCQTPLDECQSDNDCGNVLDLHWHCISEVGTRRCRRIYIG